MADSDNDAAFIVPDGTPCRRGALLEVFGKRLLFPKDFVGRGDMSRGGLLLRCCSLGSSLEYEAVLGATRRSQRPPKLED